MTNEEVRTLAIEASREVGLSMAQVISGLDIVARLYSNHKCEGCTKEEMMIYMKDIAGKLYCRTCVLEMKPDNVSQRLRDVE